MIPFRKEITGFLLFIGIAFAGLYWIFDTHDDSHIVSDLQSPDSYSDVNFDIDIVYIWTLPPSKTFYNLWEKWFRKEAFHEDYIPEPFSQDGTNYLRFILRSIWYHLPWFHHLHIVVPDIEDELLSFIQKDHPRITLLRFSQFFKHRNPTFHLNAIQSSALSIPNITEQFILMSNHMFPLKRMNASQFLDTNTGGFQYIYLENKASDGYSIEEARIHMKTKDKVDKKLQFKKEVNNPKNKFSDLYQCPIETRQPVLLKKSLFNEIEEQFRDDFERTRSQLFRSKESLDIPQLYQSYLITKVLKVNIVEHLTSFDKNDDRILDGKEFDVFMKTLEERDHDNVMMPSVNNSIIPPLFLEDIHNYPMKYFSLFNLLVEPKYRLKLKESLFLAIEESTPTESFSEMMHLVESSNLSLYIGSQVLKSRLTSVKVSIENLLLKFFPRPCPLEKNVYEHAPYARRVTMIMIIVTLLFWYCVTKYLKQQ